MEDFESLYRRYLRDVYHYLYGLCRDPDASEELTQITFSIAFEKLGAFRGDSSLSTWLYGIARLEYKNWCRKKQKNPKELKEDMVSSEVQPVDMLIQKENTDRVHEILHQLPEPYKEVFMLRVLGEMPYRNISKLFGKSEAWGRVTYYRARKMIMEQMKGEEEDGM